MSLTRHKAQSSKIGPFALYRQAMWRRQGEVIGEPLVTDTVPSVTEAMDICRTGDTRQTRSRHEHEHLELATMNLKHRKES